MGLTASLRARDLEGVLTAAAQPLSCPPAAFPPRSGMGNFHLPVIVLGLLVEPRIWPVYPAPISGCPQLLVCPPYSEQQGPA